MQKTRCCPSRNDEPTQSKLCGGREGYLYMRRWIPDVRRSRADLPSLTNLVTISAVVFR